MSKTNMLVFWLSIAFAAAIVSAGCISPVMSEEHSCVWDTGNVPVQSEEETRSQTVELGNGTSVHIEVSPS